MWNLCVKLIEVKFCYRQTDKFFDTLCGGMQIFSIKLNLLPPYSLCLQGDNKIFRHQAFGRCCLCFLSGWSVFLTFGTYTVNRFKSLSCSKSTFFLVVLTLTIPHFWKRFSKLLHRAFVEKLNKNFKQV